MTATFHTAETFFAAIAAAVKAGLTFEAYEAQTVGELYIIEYTGGN